MMLPSTIVPSRMTRWTRRECAWRIRPEGEVTMRLWGRASRDAIKWHGQQEDIHSDGDDCILRDRRHAIAEPVSDVHELVLAQRLQRRDSDANDRTACNQP